MTSGHVSGRKDSTLLQEIKLEIYEKTRIKKSGTHKNKNIKHWDNNKTTNPKSHSQRIHKPKTTKTLEALAVGAGHTGSNQVSSQLMLKYVSKLLLAANLFRCGRQHR